MKKLLLVSIGAVILLITLLCEMALSHMENVPWLKDEQWSNYVHRWDVKWKERRKVSIVSQQDPEISLCETKR